MPVRTPKILFALIALASLAAVPTVAYAQAAITGVIKDTSGGVLPGVTVEATSPALIEKVRSAVTDGTGQYRIENLRPGLYTVTFTLTGFNTVKREGIELTGTFTAIVNTDLRVGALEETITVTGETPVVDVQATTRQTVMDREVLDAIPRGANVYNLAVLVPGVTATVQDVGGAAGINPQTGLTFHGAGDQGISVSGISVAVFGSGSSTQLLRLDAIATQEVTLNTSAVDAELPMGGIRLNQIPRDGGNTFNGTFLGNFANGAMQGSNFTPELQQRGLRSPDSINKNWDVDLGLGGPLKQDRLWFYGAARSVGASQYVSGLFHDRNANNPNAWTFDPDPSRPVTNHQKNPTLQLRFTWQATPKNKITVMGQESFTFTYCPQATAIVSVQGGLCRSYPMMRLLQGDWTAPVTNRLLFEVGGIIIPYLSYDLPHPELTPGLIGVTEQSTGLTYRSSDPYRKRRERTGHYRAVVSYITGAHAVKVGMNHRSGYSTFHGFDNNPLSYRFNNGVPNQLTERAYPWDSKGNVDHDMGVFAQDKWTIEGLTLSYGVRYDYFTDRFPEQHIGPTVLAPTRNVTFPAQPGLSYHDLTPKLGAAYDLLGTGKTALKVSLNKYVAILGPEQFGGLNNPVTKLVSGVISTTRSWTDANRDFVPNCDLTSPLANGECGAMANADFGKTTSGVTYDPDLLHGWGKRNFNWEFATGVQQQLLPRVSVDVGYFRRWFSNFFVVDDLAVAATDFDSFSITAPLDPRLPGGGGYVVPGLYNVKPAKFGVPAAYFGTLNDKYGKQIHHWQGVDVNFNARPGAGLLLQGGFSTGRTVTDNCDVLAKLPEASVITISGGSVGGGLSVAAAAPSTTYCHVATAFLTQVKFLGSYTIPRVDVQFSAAFQSVPGSQILANYTATNAVVAPSLGRNLSGNAANTTVNLVAPGTMYGERLNQLDLRFAKIVRFGRTETSLNVDLYNALNGNAVLRQNDSFGAWQRPTSILLARFVKLGVLINF
jgi:hypothetical protein